MSFQRRENRFPFHFVGLPQLYGLFKATAGKPAPIRAEGQRPEHHGMISKGSETAVVFSFSSTLHFPQLDGLIVSTTGNRLSIGAEGHRQDATCVGLKDIEAGAALYIPQVDHPVVVSMR